MISLYLGGARSGKSGLAEQEVINAALPTTYIATANASISMAERIALHQAQRPSEWATKEVPLTLASSLLQLDCKQSIIIVDCLTLWLTNQMMATQESLARNLAPVDVMQQIDLLCQTLVLLESHIVLVSTEVGQSLIPDDEMSQEFVHYSGMMHQKIAQIANRVCFCQAGIALTLKDDSANRSVQLSAPLSQKSGS
ncbi:MULTISPECIES: bifunctional adenosylcobinamide kinase/adenosylcobinamide-phosphate guanylyltransferase [unclassified Shewanella]|uniref:bifunctional adenosylcobinamide kinase/adenosylcobinamide-phosphate guanylyltransferase n=1 Tax=unclassified Shewanella TaxID=196818 RepID=UPI001BC0814F|nr:MULTISPECIES: bifunctional adenosylcobinamide kinase/adenosylcobinamide-phosphate guanylyltransferase [unclassified Shewanella]GIU17025.1 bifunctional adenosylcobinamide kinase/adenosylcobinamide-phosphate guanylyltransferase [Shewanella sp. MBTL60-112-B1]GIU38761.1 bifunctional adenosylcobinamide kinase/adenosylcobinamide-phosphate guanylyltransferase [Shewanella sp. MBTL60-112-B2]